MKLHFLDKKTISSLFYDALCGHFTGDNRKRLLWGVQQYVRRSEGLERIGNKIVATC